MSTTRRMNGSRGQGRQADNLGGLARQTCKGPFEVRAQAKLAKTAKAANGCGPCATVAALTGENEAAANRLVEGAAHAGEQGC